MLAIDDVHMEFSSLVRFRKALERFLEEDLRPEDQVALVTTSGASALSQEFTADRAVLRQTLSRLSAQGRRAEWTGVPHITEYQAELIEGGDPLALDAAVQEILQAGTFQDVASAEQEARAKARGILAEAVYNSRLTLETLESLCRGLSGLTGRKTLFFVSDGFLTGLAARGGAGFDIRRIADAGTRAGVVVYALDTRGLVASPPGASAASPLQVGPSTAGMIEAMRRRSEDAVREAMNALAADTGGFLVENSNNLRAGLREMLKDTETYYVLAYEPTNTKRDGSFRRIDVRLPGVRDVKVRTRSGYFAPDDRRLAVAERTAEMEAHRAEQRISEMRTALSSLAPLTGDSRPALRGLREPRPGRDPDRRQRERGRGDAAVRPPARPPSGDGRERGARLRRDRSRRHDAADGAVRDGPDRRGLRAAPAGRASRTRRRPRSRPAGTRCASRHARMPRGCWGARGSGSRSRISPRDG